MESWKRGVLTILTFLILARKIDAASYTLNPLGCNTNSSYEINFDSIGSNSFASLSLNLPHVKNYSTGMNCTVVLVPPKGYYVHLAFSEISTRECNLDKVSVELVDSKTNLTETTELCGSKLCLSENCDKMEFDNKIITVHFQSSSNGVIPFMLKGFDSMVTIFSKVDKHGFCHTKEQFRCHNEHCIWKGLYCNKHNHCGDNSDEPPHCQPFAELTVWGILVIIFGVVSFCIFLPLFCFLAVRGQRDKFKVLRSSYQPFPASINDESLRPSNIGFVTEVGASSNSYGTLLEDSTNAGGVTVHSKMLQACRPTDKPYQVV